MPVGQWICVGDRDTANLCVGRPALPACRPSCLPACWPVGLPAFLPTSLPACQLGCLLDAMCFLLSCLPACRTNSFYLSMTHLSFFLCRHAVLPMAAAIPSLISWTFLPACRTNSFYFSLTHQSFFLCRHAVLPMAAAIPSLISWTCLPACRPDWLRYLFFFPDMPSCQWPWLCLISSPEPSCLPACRIAFFYIEYLFFFADMPSCRWPRPCLLSSFGPSSLPACRIAFFNIKYLFFLCRHAVMPMAAAISSLICWNCLPACLPAGSPLFSFPEFRALLSCALPACRMLDCFR